MTGSYNVPRGKYGTLKAYPLYKRYTFKLYFLDQKYAGKGSANKVVGYCYKHSAR
ncbi:hypothetical protein [Streptomyces sp. MNU89]|nr:hypothetical protein [Streptomyces sp. MNU89]MCC9739901.1 hypothetical protein [Streptomyces sp. MNU89]